MKRVFIAFALLWIAPTSAALACGLDDCALPEAAHLETWRYDQIPADDWAWMNHDLALARAFLEDGDVARARQIVAGLDYALRNRAEAMVESRGRARVAAFHRALKTLQAETGGQPLAALDLRHGPAADGHGLGLFGAARAEEDGDDERSREELAAEARLEAEARRHRDEPDARRSVPPQRAPNEPAPRY